MKRKGIKIVLAILLVITTSCGIVGYLQSKKIASKPNDDIKNEPTAQIIYEYYLEEQLVDKSLFDLPITTPSDETAQPTETRDTLYEFAKFSCTNEITGEFDKTKWEFVPTVLKDGTCKLYFVKSKYEITLEAGSNAIVSEENPKYIAREQDGTFIITPNEGYKFESALCSDNKEVTWQEENNSLLIKAVTDDIACKLVFNIKNLQADINVVHGEGATTEEVKYGEAFSAIVAPSNGYDNPEIQCSNNQTAKYENNKITIEKLTADTKCTVTFVEKPLEKFNLTVKLPEDNTVTIITGTTEQKVESGKSATFTLKPNEGYKTTINCGSIQPSNQESVGDGSIKYTFLNITKDITCTVTSTLEQQPASE